MATDADTKSGSTQNAGDGAGDPNKDKKPRFEFNDEQQKFIEGLIDKAVGRAHKQYKDQIDTMTEELNTLKSKPAGDGENKDGKDKDADNPDKKQFKELLSKEQEKAKDAEAKRQKAEAEAKAAKDESFSIRKEVAMTKAASKQDFYELEVVMEMTKHLVAWDEDLKTWYVKENGTVKKNASLEPMTLEEFYADFASKRQYLVKGSVVGGAGSTEGSNATGMVKSKADLKSPKQKSDFIGKYGLEAFEKLPAKSA